MNWLASQLQEGVIYAGVQHEKSLSLARENSQSRDDATLRYNRTSAESLPVNTSSRPPSSGAAVLKPRLTASSEVARDENDEIIVEIVGIHNWGSSYYQVNAGTYIVDIPAFQ
ncbi:hypothetical protein [Pseudobacteriovorax antillogorgiicola]|uniref:Uncharacterized protein n=1 Tax=Pseudobacteriovorax antillogorgiicola TaxID=1513793 RepID=A0A1Y6B8V9_9BACT|nr:hypothetical protein [Pseudobacteriovorax antillogorgiicola]TCS58797.1 hypothetical protein EDD56_102312 [Pseudobacteriovorax antillogorgiicola]SME94576.1 hypothetical protein SAMN06296036_102131 [Pseudobacteriovorax antillogorgiicola]